MKKNILCDIDFSLLMSSASFPANKKPHERGHAVWYYLPFSP